MLKKDSIFTRVLIPVILVMLIQILLISIVLFVNGTMDSLNDSSIETLRKNVEYRSITLEDTIVHSLTGLEKLEYDITTEIDNYLRKTNISIGEALGNYNHETNILYNISASLINSLRLNSSTGVFIYFIDATDFSENKKTFNGLYYRNLNPFTMPTDNSNILFLRGFVGIARKDRIQLDSLWSEVFTFSPDDADIWRGYSKPLLTALNNPNLSPENLSYWNTPHLVNPNSPVDSNECISYTRPFFYDGRLIAMIGTEIQVDQLKKFFPANDFDNSGKSGYMLVKYDASDISGSSISCDIYAITGSYIKRLLQSGNSVTLNASSKNNVYTISDNGIEPVHVALKTLRLYNVNAPFSKEQWALASIGADSMLFNDSRKVSTGIVDSSVLALIAGAILIYLIVRFSTKPLISLVDQIENNSSDNPIVLSKSNSYEVALLCSKINDMNNKQRLIENELREEKERYLVALESAADTFMEYDIMQDNFRLYYFSGVNQNPELLSNVIESFTKLVNNGEICHPDDIPSFMLFLNARHKVPIEIRVKTSALSHITNAEPDNGYYWIQLKASHINDNAGNVVKVIGIARQITAEKLEENARLEASRRDSTTGFYNYAYGKKQIVKSIFSAADALVPVSVCIIHINSFEMFEAYYGRVFSGVILMLLSRELLLLTSDDDVAVRINNDEFMIFFWNMNRNDIQNKISQINQIPAGLYVGENPELTLSLSIGIRSCDAGHEYEHLLRGTSLAAQYAIKKGKGSIVYYDELPSNTQYDETYHWGGPISVSADISKEGTVGFVFDLFERTTDTQSAINILPAVLSEIFSLSRMVICSYDADFNSNRILYQWNSKELKPYSLKIEQISYSDLTDFEQILDQNGTVLFNNKSLKNIGEGVKQLLFTTPDEPGNTFCCVMYENGVQSGRILFKTGDQSNAWTDTELNDLYEISKIVSAHVIIEKSNSASRAKSEFLSRVSHEIRTPMNAIIGMTGIAKEFIHNPERLKDYLNKIDFSAKHLLALINDVLEMSRIESGKLQIENEPFSLTDFITAIDMLIRPQIEGKNISFVIDCKTEHTDVIGDEYRLRQVLLNLLGNAGKFTDSGGTITLTVREREGSFRFSVKDTGIGISKEDQPVIFKAFEQATTDVKIRKRHDGTGLGLTISSNIISLMGGKIELISEPGVGSEFFFTLNLALSYNQNRSPTTAEEAGDYKEIFSGRRVLLAEDNDINVEIAVFILESENLSVDVARNGREAVDMFFAASSGYYDAILMDIQMPVMDGLTATREIRKNKDRPDTQTVPIIAMTADAFDADMKKSIASGMNGHIPKPVDNVKLYEMLKQIFS